MHPQNTYRSINPAHLAYPQSLARVQDLGWVPEPADVEGPKESTEIKGRIHGEGNGEGDHQQGWHQKSSDETSVAAFSTDD